MNRRAHVRQSVDIPVQLTSEHAQEFLARADDFCLGGLRVVSRDSQSPFKPALRPGDRVRVTSALPGHRGLREVSLSTRVARVDRSGVGLCFESPDAIALLTLHNHVRDLADRQGENERGVFERMARQQESATARSTRIVFALRSLVERELRLVMEMVLVGAERGLLEAVRLAKSDSDATASLQAARQLPETGTLMTRSFVSRTCNAIDSVALGAELDAPRWGDLSATAGHDEFKGWLAVKSMAARAEGRFNHEFLPLQMRLNDLFRSTLGVRQNPLHPASLCRSFTEALRITGLSAQAYPTILEALETAMMAGLGGLYRQANRLLIAEGIIPDLDMERLLGGVMRVNS